MNVMSGIVLGGPIAPWKDIGLLIERDEPPTARIGSIKLQWQLESAVGLRALVTAAGPDAIDGISWMASPPPEPVVATGAGWGRLGAMSIDHVVWMTDDLERTCGAIESSLGEPLKRIREIGGGVRQGFFRLGEVILEVVGNPGLAPNTSELWGLVINVVDLDAVVEHLGPEVISRPRAAVQRGRSIATLRDTANLGTAVALMSS